MKTVELFLNMQCVGFKSAFRYTLEMGPVLEEVGQNLYIFIPAHLLYRKSHWNCRENSFHQSENTCRTLQIGWKICAVMYEPANNSWCKVKQMFIGHSGSNHSAFYLYTVTSVGLSAQGRCGLCTVMSVSCTCGHKLVCNQKQHRHVLLVLHVSWIEVHHRKPLGEGPPQESTTWKPNLFDF